MFNCCFLYFINTTDLLHFIKLISSCLLKPEKHACYRVACTMKIRLRTNSILRSICVQKNIQTERNNTSYDHAGDRMTELDSSWDFLTCSFHVIFNLPLLQ